MSTKDPLSKIRSHDNYKMLVRVLQEFGISNYQVKKKGEHPSFEFTFCGTPIDFHFASTPGSRRTPHDESCRLRNLLKTTRINAATGASAQDTLQTQVLSNPRVQDRNGTAMTGSHDVASFFSKRHDNVLRDIDNLIESAPSCALNFEETAVEVPMPRGGSKQSRAFLMTKDGFTLLTFGFTGREAVQFKLDYIQEFNRMERELSQLPPVSLLGDEAKTQVGGIIKSVVHKEMKSFVSSFMHLLEENRGIFDNSRASTTDFKPALQILKDHKVPQHGRRGLVNSTSSRLRRFSMKNGFQLRESPETGRYLFHVDCIRQWLEVEGHMLIRNHIDRHAGQGTLNLVSKR